MSLPDPSREIIVEPKRQPAKPAPPPESEPERAPAPPAPEREPEKVPA